MIEAAFIEGELSIPLMRSAVIPEGFRHGFSTRGGGVSTGAFASLNLGMKWGDAPDNVRENRRRLRRAAGSEVIYAATQVHGADIVVARAGDDAAAIARQAADGVCAVDPGTVVSIFVADCIPVLMADVRTGAVAAVHAGWRGTVAGVLPAAVRRMAGAFGTRPQDLRVALGPAIGVCCFEVGDEVVAAVEARIPGARAAGAIDTSRPKPHVDLKRLNTLLLERAGVALSAIDAGPECTSCDRARFFSYRRDAGHTGQMVGFIGVGPPVP
jgi:YfiH family protein